MRVRKARINALANRAERASPVRYVLFLNRTYAAMHKKSPGIGDFNFPLYANSILTIFNHAAERKN